MRWLFTLSGPIVLAICTRAASTELHRLAHGNKFAASGKGSARAMDEKDEGQRAYWRGNELHDNPYPHNSLPGREWDKGYWDAVDEDEDNFQPCPKSLGRGVFTTTGAGGLF